MKQVKHEMIGCDGCWFNQHKIKGKCYCGADNFAEIAERYVVMPRDEYGNIISDCSGWPMPYIYVEDKTGGAQCGR